MNQKLVLEIATYVFEAPLLGGIDELIRHNSSRQDRFRPNARTIDLWNNNFGLLHR